MDEQYTFPLTRCPRVVFTGSAVYGDHGPESDTDIVVLVTWDELDAIRRDCHERGIELTSGRFDDESYRSPAIEESFHVGRLNFILVVTEDQYNLWRDGTAECVALARHDPRGYINRSTAVEIFQRLEQERLV